VVVWDFFSLKPSANLVFSVEAEGFPPELLMELEAVDHRCTVTKRKWKMGPLNERKLILEVHTYSTEP